MAQIGRVAQEVLRSQFPALSSDFVFLENAGGSQVPQCVIDAISGFMQGSYVQTGASYACSQEATRVFQDAHAFLKVFMNAEGIGEVALGPSTTALTHMLASCFRRAMEPGDEVIVSEANHEANIGPWALLEQDGFTVKFWGVDPETGESSLEELKSLLTDRTKVVAFPQTSNLLGGTLPVKEICDLVRSAGARSVVDGVAYASHGAIDVKEYGADFYVYSLYKVYGPHMAAMFGTNEAWGSLRGPNHFFIPYEEIPRKFELGCQNYEGCAGLLALQDYLALAAGHERGEGMISRDTVTSAYAQFKPYEDAFSGVVLDYLRSNPDIRILGGDRPAPDRHPTISFLHKSKPSDEVSNAVCKRGIGIRHGHMYSHRLCTAMNIDPEPGVVRLSAVHYNTPEEARQLTQALDEVL